jgi:endo-1,4-beta-D-glucanase Y
LITYLTKLHNESKLFSFQNAFAQKQIIKLHKFLAANLKSYMVEFPVDNYEVKNTNAVTGDGASEKLIPARTIAIKGHIDKLRDEYGFLYVLGKLDENQAKAKKEQFQNEADFTSILHNSDKPLYGYVRSVDRSSTRQRMP